MQLRFTLLPDAFAIARLEPSAAVPAWAFEGGGFCSVTRTGGELSVVCRAAAVPAGVTSQAGWRCLEVGGPLDLSMVGIVAAISGVLAAAGISVFIVSTYDTDYVLVPGVRVADAAEALRRAGHQVTG
jgi:hypothetical protein